MGNSVLSVVVKKGLRRNIWDLQEVKELLMRRAGARMFPVKETVSNM